MIRDRLILPKLLEESLNFPKGSFGQKKPVHCSFLGNWFSSQLSGVGFIMLKYKMQFSISVVYLCAYGYILNTLHDLVQLKYMYEYSQLQHWHMYKCTIMEIQLAVLEEIQLTRSLSFIVISVWHFGEPNALKFYLRRYKISKFSEGVLSEPLVLACFACKFASHTIVEIEIAVGHWPFPTKWQFLPFG